MADWAQVRWTEARQVAALGGDDPATLPEAGVTPQHHYRALREGGRRDEAIAFLGLAMPRLEAISGLRASSTSRRRGDPLDHADRQALDHSLRWLGDPDDQRRRAAREAAESAGQRAPERFLAMAVFFSGGSVSLPDLPPVLPPPHAAGKFAAGAIIAAAHRGGDPAAVLDRALDLGERIAEQGLRALSAP